MAAGRKVVPEEIAEYAQVFAMLTAPSVGPVHTRRDDGRPCRCGRQHEADDHELSAAVHAGAYDYEGTVLWNWSAPKLWIAS